MLQANMAVSSPLDFPLPIPTSDLKGREQKQEVSLVLFGVLVYRRAMETLLSTKAIAVCLFFFVLSLAAAIEIPLSGEL